MPAILTHYTFALKAIPSEDEPFRAIVNLGSQGPDTFMAYGTVPWRKRVDPEKVRQWGHTMHALPIETVYLKMMQYALGSSDKDVLFAYIDGLLMHYSVDRIFHAYIFYRSGFDENGRLVGYWNWSHGFFEAILDKTFAKRKGTYCKMDRCIKSPIEQVKAVSKMWAAVSPTHLREEDFTESYEDFVGAERLLYTPTGMKRPLFRLLGKYSTPNSQAHPRFLGKYAVIDVENKNHAVWKNPCTGEECSDSIDEMFERSLHDFAAVHELVLRAKNGENITKEFIAWTQGKDHEGSPIGQKRTLMDLCWNAMGKKSLLPPKKK